MLFQHQYLVGSLPPKASTLLSLSLPPTPFLAYALNHHPPKSIRGFLKPIVSSRTSVPIVAQTLVPEIWPLADTAHYGF